MYSIMNTQSNQSQPTQQNTVNLYGNGSIVTDTGPPPLQPIPNYTYEFVETQPDTQPVIFQNETTNIIVSAMQMQGQDELVYFHNDQSVVSSNDQQSALANYSIEIQDINSSSNGDYYTTGDTTQQQQQLNGNVLYETQQQQPQQHIVIQQGPVGGGGHHQIHDPNLQQQNIVLQQQQHIPQSNQQTQQIQQQAPSGHILKQTLQQQQNHHQQQQLQRSQVQNVQQPQQQQRMNLVNQQQQQQIVPQQNRVQQQQQQQQQIFIQQQQQQQQPNQHQQYVNQQQSNQHHQYVNQQQSGHHMQQQQQHVQNQQMIQQQQVVHHQIVQNQQVSPQQQQQQQVQHNQHMQQQQHHQQQQRISQQQHPNSMQDNQHQPQQVIIQNVDHNNKIIQRNNWEQHQQAQVRPMNHVNDQNHQPMAAGQYQTTSDHQIDLNSPNQQVYYISPMPQQQQQPPTPRAKGQPRAYTPRGSRGGTPRGARNPGQTPRARAARFNGPPATLNNIRQQQQQQQIISSPTQQYITLNPVQQRFQVQPRYVTNNVQQDGNTLHHVETIQQVHSSSPGMDNKHIEHQQLTPVQTNQKCYILKNGSKIVEFPSSIAQNQQHIQQHNVEMNMNDTGSPGHPKNVSASPNCTLQFDNAGTIKAVILPRGQTQQVLKNNTVTLAANEIPGDMKKVKILVASPNNAGQGRMSGPSPRMINPAMTKVFPGNDIRMVHLTHSNGQGQLVQCASPRPPMGRGMMQRSHSPRMIISQLPRGVGPPNIIQRSMSPRPMSPRPQQMMDISRHSPMPGTPNHVDINQPRCDNIQELASEADSSTSQSPKVEPVEPEPIKQEVKEEKCIYKPGFMALCPNCGALSQRINVCNRCNRKITGDVKFVASASSTVGGGGVGIKKEQNNDESPKPSTQNSPVSTAATENPPPIKMTTRGRKPAEPEEIPIISLSDEEEEDNDKDDKHDSVNISKKEPVMEDYDEPTGRVCGGGILDDNQLDNCSEDGTYAHLVCRTIRIGSLKFFPKERVYISKHGIKMTVPMDSSNIVIRIYKHEIVKVLAHFGKTMPVIFYYIRPNVGVRIRDLLHMNKTSKYYFDPSSKDEIHRRITLLPEKIPDEIKCILSSIYSKAESDDSESSSSVEGPCLEELNTKEANTILVKSSPQEVKNYSSNSLVPLANMHRPPVQTIFIYRPTGISINTEDYACLDREQFINDVIIDFYLGFLRNEMASPELQEKTHVFSTFFYKRLTQKPARKNPGPIEGDPNISPAKKRHSRVQNWTKNINIFEKDFVVVPICSNLHWFLAIICFPGLKGCVTLDGRPVEQCQRFKSLRKREKLKLDELQKTGKSSGTVIIGNTTISPVNKSESFVIQDGDEEVRDEADSEDEDLNFGDESHGSNERSPSPLKDFEGPVKHPCILIFDSLPQAGNGRSRVVATLRDWLSVEYEVKHNGVTRDFSKDVMIGAKPRVPMQTNYHDCGLYLLQYAERFFLEPLVDYRLPLNLEHWFTSVETSRKRYDLQHLLFVLMERQGIRRCDLNLPILNLDNPDYVEKDDQKPDDIEAKYDVDSSDERDEGDEEPMDEEDNEGEDESQYEQKEGEGHESTLVEEESIYEEEDDDEDEEEAEFRRQQQDEYNRQHPFVEPEDQDNETKQDLEEEEEEEDEEEKIESNIISKNSSSSTPTTTKILSSKSSTLSLTPRQTQITISSTNKNGLKQITVNKQSSSLNKLSLSASPTSSSATLPSLNNTFNNNKYKQLTISKNNLTLSSSVSSTSSVVSEKKNITLKRKSLGTDSSLSSISNKNFNKGGLSSLRNMRIVKKFKTDNDDGSVDTGDDEEC